MYTAMILDMRYVCMYMYMEYKHLRTYMYIYIYIYVCMHAYAPTYTHAVLVLEHPLTILIYPSKIDPSRIMVVLQRALSHKQRDRPVGGLLKGARIGDQASFGLPTLLERC